MWFESGTGSGASDRPFRVGCVLSGGQAPGGHSVIAGIYDAVKAAHRDGVVIGFLRGPHGLFTGSFVELDDARVDKYRNTGGFDIIGSGRHKITTKEQFDGAARVAAELRLDGVVIIGGDDSNTNAAVLAEDFAARGLATAVVGVPKTIDGDLRNKHVPMSFGFDTAVRTYAEAVGNLALDALSSRKYYHVCRAMGRAASTITLELALQTQPTVTLIAEEVAARRQGLASVVEEVADVVERRAASGRDYGVILVPEGLVEAVPEMGSLLAEVNDILAGGAAPEAAAVAAALSPASAAVFGFLPPAIRAQLLADRDPHGNVVVSGIETERLLCGLVARQLEARRAAGTYRGTFTPQCHFLGYEARSALPTEFDSAYCTALGANAVSLVAGGFTGRISCVRGLDGAVEDWRCGGVPLTAMMCVERRHGADAPVIRKALVDLAGRPFRNFAARRDLWAEVDSFRCPGPVQFEHGAAGATSSGGKTRVDPLPVTLALDMQEEAEAGPAGPGRALGREEYAGLVAEALTEAGAVTAEQAAAVSLLRLGGAVSDEDHAWALGQCGWSARRYAGAERAARLEAARAADAGAASSSGGEGGGDGDDGASSSSAAAASSSRAKRARR